MFIYLKHLVGKPALWLRALTAHVEDLNLVSKTYLAAHTHLSF